MELLYGEHYVSGHKVRSKWRSTFLVTLFLSMLLRAYDKVKKYGAIRSIKKFE